MAEENNYSYHKYYIDISYTYNEYNYLSWIQRAKC